MGLHQRHAFKSIQAWYRIFQKYNLEMKLFNLLLHLRLIIWTLRWLEDKMLRCNCVFCQFYLLCLASPALVESETAALMLCVSVGAVVSFVPADSWTYWSPCVASSQSVEMQTPTLEVSVKVNFKVTSLECGCILQYVGEAAIDCLAINQWCLHRGKRCNSLMSR